MKRLTLSVSFLLACVFGSACAEDGDITCDVIWTANGAEVGSTTLSYGGDDVDEALAACLEDQALHEDRPDEADMHNCNCSTN